MLKFSGFDCEMQVTHAVFHLKEMQCTGSGYRGHEDVLAHIQRPNTVLQFFVDEKLEVMA